jgi:hypothetical protein
MKNKLSKMSVTLLPLSVALFLAMNLHAQEASTKPIQKSTFSIEVDPIVPAVLHGFFWSPHVETKKI